MLLKTDKQNYQKLDSVNSIGPSQLTGQRRGRETHCLKSLVEMRFDGWDDSLMLNADCAPGQKLLDVAEPYRRAMLHSGAKWDPVSSRDLPKSTQPGGSDTGTGEPRQPIAEGCGPLAPTRCLLLFSRRWRFNYSGLCHLLSWFGLSSHSWLWPAPHPAVACIWGVEQQSGRALSLSSLHLSQIHENCKNTIK